MEDEKCYTFRRFTSSSQKSESTKYTLNKWKVADKMLLRSPLVLIRHLYRNTFIEYGKNKTVNDEVW